MNFLTEVVGLG